MKSIPRVFFNRPLSVGEVPRLEEDELKHLKVLRAEKGTPIELVDGKGSLAHATFQGPVTRVEYHPPPPPSTLVAGVIEMPKLSWVVEKACEMGLSRLVLYQAEKSKYILSSTHRLERLLISALKQSKNLYIPALTLATTLNNLEAGKTFLADPSGVRAAAKLPPDSTVLVGPESGFSPKEKAQIQQYAKTVSFGQATLRTETAMLIATWLIT
ncbi:MAG: hypothetical protein A3F09_00315 [Chlamydiae bacterium RIFCSPHIGHO2_12_FULL_49_11]|nr:MAG: hypothetical protein A3F09_00315 [Chlamydiae bacterium RIFCSPHIGHO2_12_FULL_49_11]